MVVVADNLLTLCHVAIYDTALQILLQGTPRALTTNRKRVEVQRTNPVPSDSCFPKVS